MDIKTIKSFGSDNNAPVHQEVIMALSKCNMDQQISYGEDPYTNEAIETFQKHLGKDAKVYFVYNGTGANTTLLAHLARSWEAIICPETAHIQNDECGAPEKLSGCKLLILPTTDGKIIPEQIKPLLHASGVQHHSQPKVVSISQSTELGTVYTIDELKAICDFAHEHNLYVHVDGARISNAAVSLNASLKEILCDTGVDVVSFGGTKNGLMFGEAVVFLNPSLAKGFEFTRKQATQLASKMRYIACQFTALLKDDLWIRNALHANNMAAILAKKLKSIQGIHITQKVETNAVFACLPKKAIEMLQKDYFFYVWNEDTNEVRWMTSFVTNEREIESFARDIRAAMDAF